MAENKTASTAKKAHDVKFDFSSENVHDKGRNNTENHQIILDR